LSVPEPPSPVLQAPPASQGYDRKPPFSIEAEISVLGGMLIDRDAVVRAVEHVADAMFFREGHRRIFRTMVRLFERGAAVDVITVSEELKKTGELETAGGLEYLAELVDAVPTAANIAYHARIVRDKAVMRRLIDASSQIIRDVYEPGEREVEEILDQAEAKIFQVAQSHDREGFVWIKEILWPTFEHIERLQASATGITGVPTGFADLDRMTTGLQKGDLIIVAARPSMGKTSWVMNVAQNAAIEHGVTAAIFSLEMSKEQLVQRLLCSEGRVDAQKLRRGKLSPEEYTRLATAAGHLNTAPLWIDDSPGTTVLEMRAKARRLKSETNVGLIVIDYMQLMSGGGKAENRVQEVSQISRGLKALARELDVPVIALSQLSRAPEQRTDRRPQLSDLRESGCLGGASLVPLVDGPRATIAELEGKSGFLVWALDEASKKLIPARVSRAFCTGLKPVSRLTTALGRTLRATANHRFLTIGGWKRLDELAIGEHLALPRQIPTPEEVAELATAVFGSEPGLSHPRLASEFERQSRGGTLSRSYVGRDRARRVDSVIGSPELDAPVRSDIYWDRILSIEPEGEERVYDLTVPGPHNFIANGIVAHNSLEQDADVVMFLFRPEYYFGPVDQNGNSIEGQAELIVSKQRNGPTGTVPLTFHKAYTRFESAARPEDADRAPAGPPQRGYNRG
jgi:replicative DNA helicase